MFEEGERKLMIYSWPSRRREMCDEKQKEVNSK